MKRGHIVGGTVTVGAVPWALAWANRRTSWVLDVLAESRDAAFRGVSAAPKYRRRHLLSVSRTRDATIVALAAEQRSAGPRCMNLNIHFTLNPSAVQRSSVCHRCRTKSKYAEYKKAEHCSCSNILYCHPCWEALGRFCSVCHYRQCCCLHKRVIKQ